MNQRVRYLLTVLFVLLRRVLKMEMVRVTLKSTIHVTYTSVGLVEKHSEPTDHLENYSTSSEPKNKRRFMNSSNLKNSNKKKRKRFGYVYRKVIQHLKTQTQDLFLTLKHTNTLLVEVSPMK